MTVEAPDTIRRGEQIGLRLSIFSTWDQDMEVLAFLDLCTIKNAINCVFNVISNGCNCELYIRCFVCLCVYVCPLIIREQVG